MRCICVASLLTYFTLYVLLLDRTDKKQTAEDKVKRVEGILSEDQKAE